MHRFFLHLVSDLGRVPDLHGTDFNSLDEAEEEAQASARDIVGERLRSGLLPIDGHFEICDEQGRIVRIVPFNDLAAGR